MWVDQFADQLRHGIIYPRWLPASHDGLGSPVFYYYPPLAFYPAGLLGAAGVPTYAAILATFGLGFAASGAAMHQWLKGWTARPLAGALFYMAAPYHVVDFYGRGALAEFCAIALIPLVALGLRRVAEGRGMALAAVAYAALIATHLPLALLASLFLVAPYALFLAKRRPKALLRFVPPLALGVGLSAIYLVPALALEPWRDAAALWGLPSLRTQGWNLLAIIASATLTGMGLIAVRVIAVIALPALFIAVKWRSGWAVYAIACCLVVAGFVPGLWSLPLVESVQFPFRALPFAEFGLATALALVPGRALVGLLAAPALLLSATFLIAPAPAGPPLSPAYLAERHPDVPENLPPGAHPYGWPSRWALELAARHRAATYEDGVTVEPILYFPAWRVSCQGREVETFADPATSLLAYRGTGCSTRLGRTSSETIGALASAAALALLLAAGLRRRRAAP